MQQYWSIINASLSMVNSNREKIAPVPKYIATVLQCLELLLVEKD